jgi:tRNA/tmRNA/rRNA uracil-C5-methylase (TrmA/RlmC/RlmD family)
MDLGRNGKTTARFSTLQFHCWALARSRGKLSRSTPGESVTNVFLGMLQGSLLGKVNTEECTLCHRVFEEEIARLRELAQKLQSAMFAQWMKSQGTLCLDHARKLKEFVPLRLRTLIDKVVESNRAELEEELETFREQLKHGIHEGGGLLGRAAEFLVGQRGLWQGRTMCSQRGLVKR